MSTLPMHAWSPAAAVPDAQPTTVVGRRTVAAMLVGQHVMAVLLSGIGAYRAIADGMPAWAAVLPAVLLLVWNFFGPWLLRRIAPTRSASIWWLVGFVGLWLVAIAVSPEFVWFAFLLWLLTGHLLPFGQGMVVAALVFVAVVAAPLLHHGTIGYAEVIGPFVGGAFAFGASRGYLQLLRDAAERERLFASLEKAHRDLGTVQEELAIAQREAGAIDERQRIARDIHDTIAQSLLSIGMLASSARQRTEDGEAQRAFEQLETLARESQTDVRRVLDALTPAELESGAVARALQRMLDRIRTETGIAAESHIATSLPELTAETEVALLRIAQSALANVRTHADAQRVVLSLIDDGDSVILDIIDDGKGFDLESWEQQPREDGRVPSYGLRFMRERVAQLGGTIDITSTPGEGTAISVRIPVAAGRGDAGSAGSGSAGAALAEEGK